MSDDDVSTDAWPTEINHGNVHDVLLQVVKDNHALKQRQHVLETQVAYLLDQFAEQRVFHAFDLARVNNFAVRKKLPVPFFRTTIEHGVTPTSPA